MQHASTQGGDPIAGLFLLGLAVFLYFIPSVVAGARHHHQRLAILWLNILTGWTMIGWVIAVVWACTMVRTRANA